MTQHAAVPEIDLIFNQEFESIADVCPACDDMYGDDNQSGILTVEGERHLFKRLNFLKFRADAIRSTLTDGRNSKKKLAEISSLLEDAGRVREEIAQANLRLVISIARKLSHNDPGEFDDMVAEGNAILLYAIEKFDYARGFRFSTYLTHSVQRHLYRYINRRNKQRGKELTSANEHLAVMHGRDDASEYEAAKSIAIARQVLAKVDETLDERERFILLGRLGLDKDEAKGQSFQSLGNELGLSKERIRQLFQRALTKLAKVAQPVAESFD